MPSKAPELKPVGGAITPEHLPPMAAAMQARLNFPLGWSEQVVDLPAWRAAGIAKVRELSLQAAEHTPFDAQWLAREDRGTYVARRVVFNLTADSRVSGLLLLPKGEGPFPAVVMYHDHGSRFDIGKEKCIAPWGDAPRERASAYWARRFFSGRYPGDELAQRGYVVFATDALGWSERGPLDYVGQQALAANFVNLGSSLAGLMALEDARAAEFVASLIEVDAARVAALGFSMGGFRAWQAAALSDALKACVVVNWMATAAGLMQPGGNQLRGASAWHMSHPGLLRYLDYPDVASLAAPKPMLVFAGEQDGLFPLASVEAACARLRAVWQAWQAAGNFEFRLWPAGHVFRKAQQKAAYDWLDQHFQRAR